MGVLADFNRYTIEKIGKTLDQFPDSQSGWDAMKPYLGGLYRNLEPMIDANDLVRGVDQECGVFRYRLGVLTAIPKMCRVPNARIDKMTWLSKHFPFLLRNFNIGPHAEHKQYHCSPGDILIDDSEKNIPQWRDMGGIGILHTSAAQSLKELREILRMGK